MATIKNYEKGIPLSPDDRIRMTRLSEEISGRFQEMSLIIARTLGREPQLLTEVRFLFPTTHLDHSLISNRDATPSKGITAQMVWPAPGGGGLGCYEDPPGICFACGIEAD